MISFHSSSIAFPHTQGHRHCSLQMRLQLSHSLSTLGFNHRSVPSSATRKDHLGQGRGGRGELGREEAAYLIFSIEVASLISTQAFNLVAHGQVIPPRSCSPTALPLGGKPDSSAQDLGLRCGTEARPSARHRVVSMAGLATELGCLGRHCQSMAPLSHRGSSKLQKTRSELVPGSELG